MAFQSLVRKEQTHGYIANIIEDGPQRSFPKILNSADADNNVFGRAFTIITGSDTEVAAGTGGSSIFSGILINSKEFVTSGASSGALDPIFALRNAETGDFMDMGIILVIGTTTAIIGNSVFFADSDGQLAFANTAPADHTQVPNTKVIRHNTTTVGALVTIQLTN